MAVTLYAKFNVNSTIVRSNLLCAYTYVCMHVCTYIRIHDCTTAHVQQLTRTNGIASYPLTDIIHCYWFCEAKHGSFSCTVNTPVGCTLLGTHVHQHVQLHTLIHSNYSCTNKNVGVAYVHATYCTYVNTYTYALYNGCTDIYM